MSSAGSCARSIRYEASAGPHRYDTRYELKAIGVLLEYPAPAEDAPAPATRTVLPGAKTPTVRKEKRGMKRRIEIGFVGAGNYASSMLLPHLAKLSAVGESLLSCRPERIRG
jgi:hypothetical protein